MKSEFDDDKPTMSTEQVASLAFVAGMAFIMLIDLFFRGITS